MSVTFTLNLPREIAKKIRDGSKLLKFEYMELVEAIASGLDELPTQTWFKGHAKGIAGNDVVELPVPERPETDRPESWIDKPLPPSPPFPGQAMSGIVSSSQGNKTVTPKKRSAKKVPLPFEKREI